MAKKRELSLGIDIGGTKTLVGLIDSSHQVLGRGKLPTPARQGGDAVVETIVQATEKAIAESGKTLAEITRIGVGVPGPIDHEKGIVLFCANLSMVNYPLAERITERLGARTVLRNDVSSGCYAEWKLGAGKGLTSLLGAFVGTGLGGCLVIDGKIHRGHDGNAGELGHIMAKHDGPQCGCGLRGCLELYASKSGLARRFEKARDKGEHSHLFKLWKGSDHRLKSRYLAECYEVGDPLVLAELQRSASYLGGALGGLVNLLGPQAIILGGGLSNALGTPWLNWVRKAAREQILVFPENREMILPAELGDDAGILGAALLAQEVK
jgi:glucokinase